MSCLMKSLMCCFSGPPRENDDQPPTKLSECTKKTPAFSLAGLETKAKCVRVYDADSVTLVMSLHGCFYRWPCRLGGIDGAEIRSKDKDEQRFAKASRDYLRSLILDKVVHVKCGKFDKYGRVLVYITMSGLDINQHLLDKGYAYKYNGGTKIAFADWHH